MRLAIVVLCLGLLPSLSVAQDNEESGFTIVESLEPPSGELSDRYQAEAQRKAVRTDVEYAAEIDGTLVSGRAKKGEPLRIEHQREPITFNGYGMLLAFLLVIGLLFLWLKFGGSGILLTREPRDEDAKTEAPEAWNISAEERSLDGKSLIERIAAMSDRTEALILLLRHSLLAGARSTQVRFARSDTERTAMARLPDHWSHHTALKTLLLETELAHYGGHAVTEEVFKQALRTGTIILGSAPKEAGRV